MNIELGRVVFSKAGRDTGRKFIVIEVIDENNVLISDGNLRRIEKPKKKKLKHLEKTEEIITALGDKLKEKLKVTNAEIRKALAALENSGEADNLDKA